MTTFNKGLCAAIAAALCAAAVPSAGQQSLAEVARAEEARRAALKKAAKTYSNSDLTEDFTVPAAPAAPAASNVATSTGAAAGGEKPGNASPGAPAPAAKPDGAVPTMNEDQWRREAESIRSQLARAQQTADSVSSAAADESRSAIERRESERLLRQHQMMVTNLERQWQKFEKQATDAKVPRAWIQPVPILSNRTPQ